MIEFVPLEYYYEVYLYYCLTILLFIIVHNLLLKLNDLKNINFLRTIGLLTLVLLIFYMGLRPVSGKYFIDMSTYSRYFNSYANGGDVIIDKDVSFHVFMKICSAFMNVNAFFLICAFIYIFPMFIISRKIFKEYWFYAFFMFIVAFSFWSYGTNGIRNGLATSLFLLAIAYYERKILMYLLLFFSFLCHESMILPITAFIFTIKFTNTKYYLLGWLIAIPFSIVLGGFWENLFVSSGFGGDRIGYLTSDLDESIGSSGFRFDFLFYSSFPVLTGWYFIFKKNFKDKLYNHIFNIYLICNAFWILIIRANFSNRFAYLSWFLMSLIIIYPFLKQLFFKNQQLVIAKVTLMYFGFTYLMFVLYYD
jgi:hypothetical protein